MGETLDGFVAAACASGVVVRAAFDAVFEVDGPFEGRRTGGGGAGAMGSAACGDADTATGNASAGLGTIAAAAAMSTGRSTGNAAPVDEASIGGVTVLEC